MRAGAFWRDQLPAVLLNVCGAVALTLFLLAGGVAAGTVAFITGVWAVVLALWLGCRFILQKRRLDALLALAEQLDERYLLPEVLPPPATAEEEVYRQLMRMAEKSMLEKIGAVQRERVEYKEYIEQWVHEIKTPITAGKLLCENHRSEWTRQLLAELESITRYTEQALYYARSEHTEKDYLVREIDLAEVVHAAVADNKYLLRRHQVAVSVECETCVVCTDDKWVRFILDQLIGNAVKYGGPAPALRFSCRREEGTAVLLLEDNGVGIPPQDLPRIFDKGFTGANGRAVPGSTGLGLYLCKRLCDKLGIGIRVQSRQGQGTSVSLFFADNDYVTGVRG